MFRSEGVHQSINFLHAIDLNTFMLKIFGITFVYGVRWGFPCSSDGKVSAYNAGGPGFDPWVGKVHWKRKWQPAPVLLPLKSHGWRSPVSYNSWGRKESDMTE